MDLFRIAQKIITPLSKVFLRITCEGAENVPQNGRVIIAPNHQHAIDPGLIAICIDRTFFAMAKQELFNHKSISLLLRKLGAFPTRRSAADLSALDVALSALRAENALLIFPEGTRSPDNPLKSIKSGVVALAAMSQSPIVPAAIIAPNGNGIFKKYIIRFGKPIPYWELGVTEFRAKQYRAAKALLLGRMKELRFADAET